MKLTVKDREFLERLRRLMSEKELSVEMKRDVLKRLVLRKNYGDVIKNQRRLEFRKAHKEERGLLNGCHYLLLKNADKLTEKQSEKRTNLLDENQNLK